MNIRTISFRLIDRQPGTIFSGPPDTSPSLMDDIKSIRLIDHLDRRNPGLGHQQRKEPQ
jgi:hypothetical protein